VILNGKCSMLRQNRRENEAPRNQKGVLLEEAHC